jgi:hypothetical protein
MKYFKLTKRIPKKKLLRCFNYHNWGWSQCTPNDDSNVHQLIADLLGVSINKIDNVILHTIDSDGVPEHADCMSKSVYLIPIKVTPTCRFICDDNIKKFKTGYAIKFNDYVRHSVECNGIQLIISVDTR